MKRVPVVLAGLGLAVILAHVVYAADARLWPTGTTNTDSSPSWLDKISNGTKSALNQTKDVLTLKKFSSPSPVANSTLRTPKKTEKTWLQKTFGPKDPAPPRTLGEWMSLRRSDP